MEVFGDDFVDIFRSKILGFGDGGFFEGYFRGGAGGFKKLEYGVVFKILG